MVRKNEDQRISFSEAAKRLNDGVEQIDPERHAGLVELQRVRAIKDEGMQREQARLARKLGADHPRVAALSRKREANADLQRDLAFAASQAQTPIVQPDPKAWTLHGYVRDAAFQGQHNLTVALYDEKGQWIEELKQACTDTNGYFRLTVTSAEPKPEATADTTEDKLARAAAGKAPRGAYIHVTNNAGATLYADADSVSPRLGKVLYREIILDGDVEGCPPPGGGQPAKPARGGRDTGKGAGKDTTPAQEGRYLGNRRKKEVHDLSNVKPACQIDEIAAAQREYFGNQKQARAAGYDLCAHCFGKDQSKR